jgi:hypothetical protein
VALPEEESKYNGGSQETPSGGEQDPIFVRSKERL